MLISVFLLLSALTVVSALQGLSRNRLKGSRDPCRSGSPDIDPCGWLGDGT